MNQDPKGKQKLPRNNSTMLGKCRLHPSERYGIGKNIAKTFLQKKKHKVTQVSEKGKRERQNYNFIQPVDPGPVGEWEGKG